MRALVRQLLINSLSVSSPIPADRWYGSGAVPETPPRPFAEIRFGGRFPGIASVNRRRLEVWIHDQEGSYDRIEAILKDVKNVLNGAEHRSDTLGNEIVLCSWVNDSTDLYDDGYRTNCMMSAFEIVGKEA